MLDVPTLQRNRLVDTFEPASFAGPRAAMAAVAELAYRLAACVQRGVALEAIGREAVKRISCFPSGTPGARDRGHYP